MNRRQISLLLAVLLILGLLSGCGGKQMASEYQEELQLVEETVEAVQAGLEQTDAEPEPDAPDEADEDGMPAGQIETDAPDEADVSIPLGDAPEEEEPAETQTQEETQAPEMAEEPQVQESGEYSTPEEVAEYIHLYGHLPGNYITKNEARDLGWDNSRGNLWDVAPGKSIGGDRFGNYEGLLPEGSYKECDVNYQGGYRGGERIIYGKDGSIYYTDDHYNSFTQLY